MRLYIFGIFPAKEEKIFIAYLDSVAIIPLSTHQNKQKSASKQRSKN